MPSDRSVIPLGYSGQKADGTGVAGGCIGNAAELARRLFEAGYRNARIVSGDAVVGGVSTREDGVGVWWGASE